MTSHKCLDKYDKEKYNSLTDISNYPDFSEFSTSLVEFMKNNESKFDKIVVDVSQNTGGFTNHLDSFANKYREKRNFK